MKIKQYLWIFLWLLVGCISMFAIFDDNKAKKKNADSVMYAEKCYDINGTRCISLEQMTYIANEKLSCEEIDAFSQMCRLVMKKKSDRKNWSSQYGFENFKYEVSLVESGDNLVYNFYSHFNSDYINLLRSDLKEKDTSAKENWTNDYSGSLSGSVNDLRWVTLTWNLKDGSILVAIGVKR